MSTQWKPESWRPKAVNGQGTARVEDESSAMHAEQVIGRGIPNSERRLRLLPPGKNADSNRTPKRATRATMGRTTPTTANFYRDLDFKRDPSEGLQRWLCRHTAQRHKCGRCTVQPRAGMVATGSNIDLMAMIAMAGLVVIVCMAQVRPFWYLQYETDHSPCAGRLC